MDDPPARARPTIAGRALLLAAAFWAPAATADEATALREQAIVAAVDGHRDETVDLLRRAVDIPSATADLAGVRKVGEVFRAEFEAMGFATRWAEMPEAMHRAGHLIAEREGTRGRRILLIGHLDTVLEGEPFARDGATARGTGAEDMKGGDVILVSALKALHRAGALDGARIVVVLTGDEEEAGMPIARSRRDLVEVGSRSDVALAFESSAPGRASIARRGALTWRLDVTGVTGHSSAVLKARLGGGAIYEVARILDAFRQEVGGMPEVSINPGVLVGGTDVAYDDGPKRGTAAGATNVVARAATVEGDLRFNTLAQKEQALGTMRSIVGRNLPRTSATLRFSDEYPAMPATEGNLALLRELDRVSRDLGLGEIRVPERPRQGAGDISFVAHLLDGLDGLGARGGKAHAPGEFVDLESLPPQIKRAAVLIDRLARTEPAPPQSPTPDSQTPSPVP